MTTNIERAAATIREAFNALSPSITLNGAETVIAQALADDGRLMPDPPRPMQTINPNWAKFSEHIEASYGAVLVYFAENFGEESESLTPAEAREYALELRAAADYIEQEQNDV